jgi:hypothetical protein
VAQQLKAGMRNEVLDVLLRAGEKIIETNDIVTFGNQAVTEMRSKKSGPTRDEDRLAGYDLATIRRS